MRPLEKKASHNKSRGAMLKKNLKKRKLFKLKITKKNNDRTIWQNYKKIS